VSDLEEIIRNCQPHEIYITNEVDSHADHRASGWFVRDAAQAASYRGTLLTYVVHGHPPSEPPGRRVSLNKSQLETKRATIEEYQVGISPIHDNLASKFTLPEDLFWPVQVGSRAK